MTREIRSRRRVVHDRTIRLGLSARAYRRVEKLESMELPRTIPISCVMPAALRGAGVCARWSLPAKSIPIRFGHDAAYSSYSVALPVAEVADLSKHPCPRISPRLIRFNIPGRTGGEARFLTSRLEFPG